MKKIYYLFIIILFFVSFDVYAESHDVEAKYEKIYNVDAFGGVLNNNTIEVKVNNYSFEFSSTLSNVEVVIIKAEEEANNYAKTFSLSEENYYLLFFKDGKKINNSEIKIRIKNDNKALYVYDHLGNMINSSKEYIIVSGNDYFFSVATKEYTIVDPDSFIQDLENIKLDPNSLVEIYNHKGNLVSSANVLGTGYKVKVNNNGIINDYTIIVNGDVDSDGKISVLDIVKINNHIIYEDKKLEDIYVLAGNYDKDDKLSVLDIVKINNAIIGGK